MVSADYCAIVSSIARRCMRRLIHFRAMPFDDYVVVTHVVLATSHGFYSFLRNASKLSLPNVDLQLGSS